MDDQQLMRQFVQKEEGDEQDEEQEEYVHLDIQGRD